jgi:hypothetical protein
MEGAGRHGSVDDADAVGKGPRELATPTPRDRISGDLKIVMAREMRQQLFDQDADARSRGKQGCHIGGDPEHGGGSVAGEAQREATGPG